MAATSGTTHWEQVALRTENDRFKASYAKYIRWATVGSILIWIGVFLFSPVVEITPYRLAEETVEVIDIPETLDIPPPPKELPRPQVPIEAAPDNEVDEEVEIADTLPSDFDYVPPPPGGGGSGTGFVAFDTKPEILNFAPPVYSEFAREAGLEGLIIVNVLVGTDGRVKEAVLAQPGHSVLNQAALTAARKCLFSPGKQRNIPVEVWVSLPYNFKLF